MTVRTWCKGGAGAELLVRGARAVDPLAGLDQVVDVLVRRGRIVEIGDRLEAPARVRVIEAEGELLLPGFVDLHTHLRTPGREDEEDLGTASAAAAAGGYVAIFGMANTDPAVDSAAVLEGLSRQASAEATVPTGFYAAMSRELAGGQLTEMHELAQAGAVGFSDDGVPVATAQLLRRALQYAKVTDRFVAVHAQDDSLMGAGVMHEGAVSAKLGLGGIPAIAESADVARALEVARYEAGRLHLCHLSTALALEHLERARGLELPVTRRSDAPSPDAHRRGRHEPRSQPQDEPAAAARGRPPRAGLGAAQRPRRLRGHRPRTARRVREGGALRGGALRHDRPRDGLRRALHWPRGKRGARARRPRRAHEPGARSPRRAAGADHRRRRARRPVPGRHDRVLPRYGDRPALEIDATPPGLGARCREG